MSILRQDPRTKGVTYIRASTCLPSDELEPCLRNGMSASMVSHHGHYPIADVKKARFREIYHRPAKGDCMGKCVICLLVHAIFIFGVFLAFLIGHWMSEVEFGNDTFLLTSLNRLNPNFTATFLNSTINNETDTSTSQSLHLSLSIQRKVKNITLMEVYPPSKGTEDTLGFYHPRNKYSDFTINLPGHFKPVHYDLSLDFTEFSTAEHIRGNVSILLEYSGNVTQKEIIFYAAPNIFIHRLKLEHDKKTVKLGEINREFKKNLVKVLIIEKLKKTWYRLRIEFRTRICQSNVKGVHCIRRTIYTRDNSTTIHKIAGFTTKFEPTFAHTFLPCWDEPKLKATFNVTVRHNRDLTVLSNSALIDEYDEIGGDNKFSRFKETPRMSIYLLAFVLTDFTPLELRTQRNLPLTVWSDPQKLAAGHFTASFSPVIFDRIEKDLEVLYPLQKLDIVLTPNYPVGGMENWGLIILQEDAALMSSIIMDEQNMTVDRLAEQYKIEKIITHEVVHQWFGDLVTMSDWSNLWLNEGFATYFVFDYLNIDHPYLTDNEYYLQLVGLVQSQISDSPSALVEPIENADLVSELFHHDNVYTKGSVIVKMIKDLLGVEMFREGITKFLKDNSYKSISTDNIWDSFPTFADHGVEDERLSDVMKSWLEKKGLPEIILSRNYEEQTVRITQRTANLNNYIIFLNEESKTVIREEEKKTKRSITATDGPETFSTFNDSYFEHATTSKPYRRRNYHRRKNAENRRKSTDERISVFGEHKMDISKNNTPKLATNQFLITREQRRRRVKNGSDQLWSIPFSYSFGSAKSSTGQTVRQFWLHNETVRFVDLGVQAYQYVLANPHWIYPYKVNYDIDNWRMLIKQLHRDNTAIPVMSRMQLLVDADTYLKQSGVPQLYINLLGYLSKEEDLGVLLQGLDQIHEFVDMISGTNLVGPLLVHWNPVIQQLDRLLQNTASNPELASVWLLSPRRLAKLYQLRCVANLQSCDQNKQMSQWMSHPTALDPSHHQQITAICHYLFTQAGPSELSMLMGLLKLRSGQWSVNIQLATCVRDETLIASVVDKVVKTKNAAVYLSVLQYTARQKFGTGQIFFAA
uniref:Peptidase_M1 domain-containing protein n=1 Tax=Bursaphelenchus xylophilus TaxID=6326 RepID=A0A1I7S331_BURXY